MSPFSLPWLGATSQEFPVERMMRDATITQIYEGTKRIESIPF